MTTFIMAVLAVFALAFLVMITVQMLRIEKNVSELVEISEVKVSRMFDEPGK